MELGSYTPWSLIEDVSVGVPGEDGSPIVVALPYVAAKSREAFITTAVFFASKALHDHKMAHSAGRSALQIANLRGLVYEPPLVRFKCEECNNEWDAWIAEDGSLEDKWSCVCTNGSCPKKGFPATLLPYGE